jgi:hypothetical protein
LPHPSRWHAKGHGMQIVGKKVFVKVRNRGQSPATGVVVRVSYSPRWLPANPNPPAWDRTTWTSLGPPSAPKTVPPETVPPGPAVPFGPFTGFPTIPGRYLFLAEATCAGDPANTDSVTPPLPLLPCSTQPTPIVDLVAGDNNLGLCFHVVH